MYWDLHAYRLITTNEFNIWSARFNINIRVRSLAFSAGNIPDICGFHARREGSQLKDKR